MQDGTTLKAKVVVRKILRFGEITPQGYPSAIGLDSMNIITAIVPPSLKSTPTNEPWDATRDVGEEIRFEVLEEKPQQYVTTDGYKITVKPVVTKVFKYNKFNGFGEPIYNATIQSITNIERFTSTATRPVSGGAVSQ